MMVEKFRHEYLLEITIEKPTKQGPRADLSKRIRNVSMRNDRDAKVLKLLASSAQNSGKLRYGMVFDYLIQFRNIFSRHNYSFHFVYKRLNRKLSIDGLVRGEWFWRFRLFQISIVQNFAGQTNLP